MYRLALISVILLAASAVSADTVASVKGLPNDTPFAGSVTGTVTSVGGGMGQLGFTIQDATDGVFVFRTAKSPEYKLPNVGDAVTITGGTKKSVYGTIFISPASAAGVVVSPQKGQAPAPEVFDSLTDFLAAKPMALQGKLVHVRGVHLVVPLPEGAGTKTWLTPESKGAIKFQISDGKSTTTLQFPPEMHGVRAKWAEKIRPSEADSNDTFDVVGVDSYNLGAKRSQIMLCDPAGTAAKADATGPIRASSAKGASGGTN